MVSLTFLFQFLLGRTAILDRMRRIASARPGGKSVGRADLWSSDYEMVPWQAFLGMGWMNVSIWRRVSTVASSVWALLGLPTPVQQAFGWGGYRLQAMPAVCKPCRPTHVFYGAIPPDRFPADLA